MMEKLKKALRTSYSSGFLIIGTSGCSKTYKRMNNRFCNQFVTPDNGHGDNGMSPDHEHDHAHHAE
jgi:hypothetical protein